MKDIRIITGTHIIPSSETVSRLLGDKNALTDAKFQSLYQELLSPLQMHIRPKAALAVSERTEAEQNLLYALLTLGNNITRLLERYLKQNASLKALLTDAMADSCLFAFEEQLLPVIQQIAREKGRGVKRLELPGDLPMEAQKAAYEAVEAKRTLGLSITSGYMLNPAKSLCLVFELTEDTSIQDVMHNCGKCPHITCSLRNSQPVTLQIDSPIPQKISCRRGSNLFQVLQEHQILLPSYCGGRGTCGKCGIRLQKGCLPITPEDRTAFSDKQLQQGMRLSCNAILQQDLTISIEHQESAEIAAIGSKTEKKASADTQNAYRAKDCGIAIDIGTTTLAFALAELREGALLSEYRAANSQRICGADVISRIQAANSGKQEDLRRMIKSDLLAGIAGLLEQSPISFGQIRHIVIAANTVMLHLFRGYSCKGLSRYPFTSETLRMETHSFEELFPGSSLKITADVSLLPGISAFVGADITAGLYACNILADKEPALFIDLGTNGELALKAGNRIFTASTAAGPAFEGGNIKWGIPSIPGAILGIAPSLRTIDNKPPKGICGTGIIEIIADLLHDGSMDSTGKLAAPYFEQGYPLARTSQGEWILLTQQDIREFQMAKAAIRAGIELLFFHAGLSCEDAATVYLAGAFGYYLNPQKAAVTGLLPKALASKTVACGNTSLRGAMAYLQTNDSDSLQNIKDVSIPVSLAEDDRFQELYLEFMAF